MHIDAITKKLPPCPEGVFNDWGAARLKVLDKGHCDDGTGVPFYWVTLGSEDADYDGKHRNEGAVSLYVRADVPGNKVVFEALLKGQIFDLDAVSRP